MMLSCFYIDKANYQENVIPRLNKKDGHDVMIIASTEVFVNNIIPGYTQPGKYINEDGIPVLRLPYKNILLRSISNKVRAYPNLYKSIADFAPDIIFFHGAAAYALHTVAKYKRLNPQIRFFVDSHADFNNSAKNFLSKHVLHKIFYKNIIKKCLPYIDKILFITFESSTFLQKAYCIPSNLLLFYPLGGIIPEPRKREFVRKQIRSQLKMRDDQILMIHSGKLDVKKKTLNIVDAFRQVSDQNLRLIIIGSMDKDVANSTIPIIDSDSRIHYLGWLNSDLLQDYLCASDLYIQLGGQSVTMQNAVCCGCSAAIFPYESHKYLLNDSVFYIKDESDLVEVIKIVLSDRSILEQKRKESFSIALNVLDYTKISAKIYTI